MPKLPKVKKFYPKGMKKTTKVRHMLFGEQSGFEIGRSNAMEELKDLPLDKLRQSRDHLKMMCEKFLVNPEDRGRISALREVIFAKSEELS